MTTELQQYESFHQYNKHESGRMYTNERYLDAALCGFELPRHLVVHIAVEVYSDDAPAIHLAGEKKHDR